jgi:hypothetical protein
MRSGNDKMAIRALKLGWCSVRINLPVCLAGEKHIYIYF